MIFYGPKFKSIRESLNLTQGDIARQLGISYQSVEKWEKGINAPRLPKVYKLAEILRCSPSEFAEFEPGEYREKKLAIDVFRKEVGPDMIQKVCDDLMKQVLFLDIDATAKEIVMKTIQEYGNGKK